MTRRKRKLAVFIWRLCLLAFLAGLAESAHRAYVSENPIVIWQIGVWVFLGGLFLVLVKEEISPAAFRPFDYIRGRY